MNGMMVTITKRVGVGEAEGETMEFHIWLHFGQGETTYKKKDKKKKKGENVFFIFTLCFFQVFPIKFVNYRVCYTIVIIIYQNRTVNVL